MQPIETIDEARRVMEICNACRYCEGFCAVFPAMEKRRLFVDADLDYLSNLCHDCGGCYHACQYAPPHEFGVNVPEALAARRAETYEKYAWPASIGAVFRRNGTLVSVTVSLALAAVVLLTLALAKPEALWQVHEGPGAFYSVIPYSVMVTVPSLLGLFIILSLVVSVWRFRRATAVESGVPLRLAALAGALKDTLTLRYLGGDGDGCNDVDDTFSHRRRIYHQFMMYGFLLCFAATCVATVYDHLFGWKAPYAFASLPVILGTLGGIGLLIGTVGLIWIRFLTDSSVRGKWRLGMDIAFLVLLFFTSLTGLALMFFRATPAMGTLLAVHLGFVLGLFLVMPYSKFVHAFYRFAALVQYRSER